MDLTPLRPGGQTMRTFLLCLLPACAIVGADAAACSAQWTQNKVDIYGRFGARSLGTPRKPARGRMFDGLLRGPSGEFLGRARPYRGMAFDGGLPLYGNVGPTEPDVGAPRPAPPPEIPRVIPLGRSYVIVEPPRLSVPRLEPPRPLAVPRWKPPVAETRIVEQPVPERSAPQPFRIPQTPRERAKPNAADRWFRA